jgi:hypothetical protein
MLMNKYWYDQPDPALKPERLLTTGTASGVFIDHPRHAGYCGLLLVAAMPVCISVSTSFFDERRLVWSTSYTVVPRRASRPSRRVSSTSSTPEEPEGGISDRDERGPSRELEA